jgi:hypothetical protein
MAQPIIRSVVWNNADCGSDLAARYSAAYTHVNSPYAAL